ncbi:hypothetical protein D9757_001110 [Collybiopsis confluens]|uniref:Uncharacterized protein n=1 Tax=Collybiopsis confluens TaxID=2823264 RepID=A0A8H5I0L9_9AGAR|nr:hypothetical protein D9757_001110 [Collybiopsis confluens]
MKVLTPKTSLVALANLFLLGTSFLKGASAQCFPDCPEFQDGWGDFGLDTNPPEPGYTYNYAIFAYPHGTCDYIFGEDEPLNPPYPPDGLLNKNQPNCPPIWDGTETFRDNFNDTGRNIGACIAFTCVFPKGICTWNDRGEVIYADPSALCPALNGCDKTHTC